MPRRDRTFKTKDVIRIINNNLSQKERVEVIIRLCSGIRIEDFGQGPILVPITSDEEAVEEVDFVETISDLVSGAVVSKLPGFLSAVADIALDRRFLVDFFEESGNLLE